MSHSRFAVLLVTLGGILAASLCRAAGADPLPPDTVNGMVEQTWHVQDAMRRGASGGGGAGALTTPSDAAGGVDGVKNGGFGFHTPLEDKPWWQVDLGKVYPLGRVVIYNRCSPDSSRAFRLCVLLSDDGKAWREVYRHGGTPFFGVQDNKPLVVALDGAAARFVRTQLPLKGYLHLDEVEVYAQGDDKTNIALKKPADQSNVSTWSAGKPLPPAPETMKDDPIGEAIARARGLLAGRQADGIDVADARARLRRLKDASAAPPADPKARRELYLGIRRLIRRLVLADGLLNFDKLLFVQRITFGSSHIYTDHYDGSHAMGGNLCILSPVAPDGTVTEIVPELSGGLFGRFDLSFDAKRVVFAYKKPGKGYRIYEVGIDGQDLRQLTHDGPDEAEMIRQFHHGYDDLDPCYLPNGRVMFASTRSKRTVLCHSGFTTTSLHVMDADGGNLRCLSDNPINEFTPAALPDGRVIYTRWEYVDKGCGDVQSLWAMHPDGSHSVHVYKNNVSRPATLIDARAIPGSSRFVAVGAPHMPLAVGSIILIDIGITQRTPAAMTNLTPEIGLPGHSGYPHPDQGYYKEPWPLSEDLFLVAYNPDPRHSAPTGYGLYLLDSGGNRELIYRDPKISSFQPIPLRPRPVPPVIPPAGPDGPVASAGGPAGPEAPATLFMQDVYQGMDGIERGRVKYLRVVEDVPKPWKAAWLSPAQGDSLGLQNPAVSLNGHFAIKKIHGIAGVDPDGSAHFRVPANRNLYFQALDADYMELQRMRTFVNLMPGETRSCIGCHELRHQAPPRRQALAAQRPPQPLVPQPGDTGPRPVHYPVDVQPVLDRRCVTCHGATDPKAGLDLTGELTALFNRSYESIIRKKLINNIDVDPRSAYIPAEPPLTFGSHRSKLVQQIRKAPCNGGLTRDEFIRLVTWIDTNANFYGVYEGKKNIRWKDAADFRPDPQSVAAGPSGVQ